MWKLFGKKFRSGAGTANSVASSVTDLRGKFSLEKVSGGVRVEG